MIVGADRPGTPIMSDNATPYLASPAGDAESPTTETLVAWAHAHRQGVSYETGEQLLARLPERLHALTGQVLGGRMSTGELASSRADRQPRTRAGRHRFAPALSW